MSNKEEDKSNWHYVKPKKNCIHCRPIPPGKLVFQKDITKSKCQDCGCEENWLCLTCGKVLCSRYKNGHMAEHFEKEKHSIAVSFSDLSFWCFKCNAYIVHKHLTPVFGKLHKDKFGEPTRIIKEHFEDEEKVKRKAKIVAEMISEAKHCVVYTGAGVSTSASIPDFRGPTGCWTLRDQKISAFCPTSLEDADPTLTHMAIFDLYKRGFVNHVVSTNVDGLHVKSGLPLKAISELHGNAFKEYCVKCKKMHYRKFDVASEDDDSKITVGEFSQFHYHYHGRKCDCGGHLIDTIVAFGENLPKDQLDTAYEHSRKCDLSIVIGTRLSVTPACKLPFKGKKKNKNAKVVYINLQKSSYDHKVDIKCYNRCDLFMSYLMKELGNESIKKK